MLKPPNSGFSAWVSLNEVLETVKDLMVLRYGRILKGKWDSVNHSAMVKYNLYKVLRPYVALLNAEIDSLILACPSCGCSSRCECGEWTLEELKNSSEKVLVNLKIGEAYISE